MTDSELLKLAAKAVGWRLSIYSERGTSVVVGAAVVVGDGRVFGWRPLTDDGDALRLAVKLRLVIQHAPKYVVVMDCERNVAEHQDTRENAGDANAATRRAIVRAAAEIGRQA